MKAGKPKGYPSLLSTKLAFCRIFSPPTDPCRRFQQLPRKHLIFLFSSVKVKASASLPTYKYDSTGRLAPVKGQALIRFRPSHLKPKFVKKRERIFDRLCCDLKMAVGRIHSEESTTAELKFVHSTNSMGRKRVALSKTIANLSSPCCSPTLKKWSRRSRMERLNRLEALPQDILVRILCKADHSDLKQLLLASKTLNAAALIARKLHFAFSTPISKPKRPANVANNDAENCEEAPFAPKQQRVAKSRLDGLKLSGIAVALFTEDNE